ncbi:PapD-like protein [Parachaetomium inaequale]|uniref:PapD-like protein n=1 Tax=Parachaetomium inaequale TaxID=2588326 RepID=A0AAN6PGI1_9PEZI|nr:PapD-like protein [Parachaetomium inaequale]
MSVDIDPVELGFRRPFTVEVSQVLKIKNPNSSPVAFKVKTTAPKQYCVRPNSGRIEPGHEVEVSVLLQAMKQEPPADAKCRDKFLVQSVIITADKEFSNVTQIWDGVERSAIQEKKIRVTWLGPSSEGPSHPVATPVRQMAANGFDATPDTAPPSYSSPQDDTTILEDAQAEPKEKDYGNEPESTQATQATAFAAPAAAMAATVKSAAADTYEELKDQLAKAEATITSLRNEVASGLRQRKTGGGTSAEDTSKGAPQLAQAERQTQQARGTEGVPVQIVAVLCLVSFLLAYFFF